MRVLNYYLLIFISASLLTACSGIRPAAHLVINNDSDTAIPLRVSIIPNGKSQPSREIIQTVSPGIHEVTAGNFSKGSYNVITESHGGKVSYTQNLSLDAERWIIINYTSNDSLRIQKKYGYVDTTVLKKINGRYTGIEMFAENRRLPTL